MGATLITAAVLGVRPLGGVPADVLVGDGKIIGIEPAAQYGRPARAHRIDASGLIMLPAFVDLHTHLREPGDEEAETIASGTRAAAAGGFSDVFAMANCDPVTDSARRVEHIAGLARNAACRVHPVGAVTVGLAGEQLAPIAEMARAGARMFSDDGRCVTDAALLRAALRESGRARTLVAQHAQCDRMAASGQVNAGSAAEVTGLPPWPAVAEEAIAARDVVLAGETGARLHICHVSTAGTVEVVRWAKQRGWPVTAEVTPHHLLLTDDRVRTADATYKVNPPLRTAEDVGALRAALADGTIDVVATDHAPHAARRKTAQWRDAAFGMTGLESALSVVAEVLTGDGRDGEPDWPLIAELMSRRPARIGGIEAIAGRPLDAGEPATFALVDPQARWRLDPAAMKSLSRNTPFAFMSFRHRVVATVVDGRVTSDAAGVFQ